MRLRFLFIFVVLAFVLILSRVYYLSIRSNIYYEELAKQNAVKSYSLAPTRGLIYDRKGRLLATNDLGFQVLLKPALHRIRKNRKTLDEELAFISSLFPNTDASELRKAYAKEDSAYKQDAIELIDFVPYETMLSRYSELAQHENIIVSPTVKRKYPYKNIASHIIGHIARADKADESENEIAKLTHYVGKTGIEAFYNDILQGEMGFREVKVNALNKEIEELQYKKASSKDVNLTIDIELQAFLSKAFAENSGAAVIMDARNGEILAAGSYPEFDLNLFVSGMSHSQWGELQQNPNKPMNNRLINGRYPPGSVVKMGVALSFLNSGLVALKTTFECTGAISVSNRLFRCWNRHGHGKIDLKNAIKHSCDGYFYEGSMRVGIDKIAPTLAKMGFGQKTGVDLPGESVGILPTREWRFNTQRNKRWLIGETLNTAIGQGNFLVTPIQIARYTAQIASAKDLTPHFNKAWRLQMPENAGLANKGTALNKGSVSNENAILNKGTALNENAENSVNFLQNDNNLSENSAIFDKSSLYFSENLRRLNSTLSKQKDNNASFFDAIDDAQNPNKNQMEHFNANEKLFLNAIRDAMLAVTREQGGTAYVYFMGLPLKVAAKTGTAQVVGFSQTDKKNVREKDLAYYSRSHTWLTSFAPYDKPRYVVTVLLEHGGKTTTSGALTVQIYKKLIEMGYFK